jgi:hypothetical protein
METKSRRGWSGYSNFWFRCFEIDLKKELRGVLQKELWRISNGK